MLSLKYIERARLAHGNKYDYSKVVVDSYDCVVTIICPDHGEFKQRINNHIHGAGCNNCAIEERSRRYRLPLDEFVERSNVIHDNKYDYSKVDYTNNKDKVIIICPVHGEFKQLVLGHLSGYGCYECGKEKARHSQKEYYHRTIGDRHLDSKNTFISKAKSVHGDFYDYSKVDWKGSNTPVIVICPLHGEFKPHPHAHSVGSVCPTCSRLGKYLTKEEFVDKVISVHGDRYTYNNVDYRSARDKINITCHKHGDFKQTPNSHLNGNGCPGCYNETRFMTTEGFIEKACAVHGNRYDYSKVEYVSNKHPVTIGCKTHGDFRQPPNTHLNSNGCYKCGKDGLKITQEDWIKRANEAHKNYYDYSKLSYVNNREPVTITCPKHGDFEQRASTHLRGSGCRKCWISKGESRILEILEEEGVEFSREYTIPSVINKYRFDFYLPEYKLLIEYHGIQHYEPIDYFGGVDTLEYIQANDQNKRILAKASGHILLEIKYDVYESLSEEEFKRFILKKLAQIGKK